MKVIYILASQAEAPVPRELLREELSQQDLAFIEGEGPHDFAIQSGAGSRVEAKFERLSSPLGWSPDLLTGSEEAQQGLRTARSLYRLSLEPGGTGQPSVTVFEALWCARSLMEHVTAVLLDVTAFKIHDAEDVLEITELDFDIRDHINLHAVEVGEGDAPLWVHSHGMEKFGIRDIEAFHLAEADLKAAENFFHQLCTDMAFGQGPAPHAVVETGNGNTFMLVPSEEARPKLIGLGLETFEGHEGPFFTIVSPEGRHTAVDLLKPYRGHFDVETEEQAAELQTQAEELMPAFKARFQRKGLMEPLTFLVRASFETHPDKAEEASDEDLWAEVLAWGDKACIAKLVDGSEQTTEWRKGVQVEVEEDAINAIALTRDGRPLDDEEFRSFLLAERPS